MSEKSHTRFKNLSNELFFDIFQYLYGGKLFNTFYGLNYRINHILNDSNLLIHIIFSRLLNIKTIPTYNNRRFA